MDITLKGNNGEKVVIPIEDLIQKYWSDENSKPNRIEMSAKVKDETILAAMTICDEKEENYLSVDLESRNENGEETKESYPGIWLTTDNVKSHRHGSWFRLELPNDTNDIVMGHLYAGDDDMETDQPLAIIADGVRADGDESKRILWVDEDVTCVKSMNDDYLNRQKAITEKQLSDLSSGIFLQNFDYIVYGKRLASKSENTVEFVENTIVSHNKQELEVVASGMEAMGLSVETGYYDPDDESSVDVPKQLIGFHYVVLKKNTL